MSIASLAFGHCNTSSDSYTLSSTPRTVKMSTFRAPFLILLLAINNHVLCEPPVIHPNVESVKSPPQPYVAPNTQPGNPHTNPGANPQSPPPSPNPPPPQVYYGGQSHVRHPSVPGAATHPGPVPLTGVGPHATGATRQGAAIHPTGTAQLKTVKTKPNFNQGNSVSFSSTGSGPGQRQCSFTLSSPNTYQVSSDNFAYPSSMVEQAADNSPLAKEIFSKYLQHKNNAGSLASASPALRNGQIPGFGGRSVPNLAGLVGGQGNNNGGFDGQFGRIGRTVDAGEVARFPHATPQFPDNVIQPGRSFGFNNGFGNSGSFQNPFSNFQFKRKKRQAISGSIGLGNQVQSVCPSKKGYIYSFKKYNVDCYPYQPEVQGFQAVKCTQEKCNHCGSSGARCVEELVSAWVWSFCHQGPQGNNLSLEYIEYPAFCVCKAIQC